MLNKSVYFDWTRTELVVDAEALGALYRARAQHDDDGVGGGRVVVLGAAEVERAAEEQHARVHAALVHVQLVVLVQRQVRELQVRESRR